MRYEIRITFVVPELLTEDEMDTLLDQASCVIDGASTVSIREVKDDGE